MPSVVHAFPFRRAALAGALLLALPAPSSAQEASVGAVAYSARHRLLGDPLAGVAVGVRFPRPAGRLAWRVGAERVVGDAERLGIACAGLVAPGTCHTPEPLRDAARLTSAGGGLSYRVLGGGRAALALTADLALAFLRVHTTARASDWDITATKALWDATVGAEAAWAPVAGVPLALEIAGTVGGLTPVNHVQASDGYTPFERGFDTRRLRLGVVWRGLAGGR